MAWRCTGRTNAELVENLWREGFIKSPAVKAAFLKVDRAHYAPSSPYEDSPQSIGHSATISAPHMHASAVDSLLPFLVPAASAAGAGANDGQESSANGGGDKKQKRRQSRPRRVLDIGSGSGYLTHVLAEIVIGAAAASSSSTAAAAPAATTSEQPIVVGLEHISQLRDLGEGNMSKSSEGRALLESGRVRFRLGDGRKGWREPDDERQQDGDEDDDEAGWDAIHVGAAAASLHQELIDQLRRPGRMFIPVGDEPTSPLKAKYGMGQQYIWTVDKDEQGKVTKTRGFGVRYVPLTDAPPAN